MDAHRSFSRWRRGEHRRSRPWSPPARNTGLSLHEFLTSLAIVSVLVMAVVSLRPAIENNRLTALVNLLATDLHLARTEALKRGRRVVLCHSRSAAGCDSGSQWHEGWIVFVDENGDNRLDGGEALLRVQGALAPDITLRYANYSYLAYTPIGQMTRDGTFVFCDRRGAPRARGIVINWSGRTRIVTRDSDNKPLQCSLPK